MTIRLIVAFVLLPFVAHADLLQEVNTSINKVPYVSDQENYGVDNHWASVEDFMERGGDCEDYALAKFDKLRHLDDVELVMGFYKDGLGHALLKVGDKILDNVTDEIMDYSHLDQFERFYFIPAASVDVAWKSALEEFKLIREN